MRRLNPRGVRKIDVQKERREARKLAKANAQRIMGYFADEGLDAHTWRRIEHFLGVAFEQGWERGFRDTQKRALDRLDEAISTGRIEVKS